MTPRDHGPVPCLNVITGSRHASNSMNIQEFRIVPHQASSSAEASRIPVMEAPAPSVT
ncbi:hypothetical protein [Salinicola lusitanus]|uniref:hypothetical protein n=1 Tax=Salinicola lusitanus TaxID=1949085 RepID=UPI000DA16007|nr:hypothetical protein [Salinicola lusitanus]